MTRTGPRPLFGFLPWLLASVAAHAVLLAQWPQAGAPPALEHDTGRGKTLEVQVLRRAEPAAPAAGARPARTATTSPGGHTLLAKPQTAVRARPAAAAAPGSSGTVPAVARARAGQASPEAFERHPAPASAVSAAADTGVAGTDSDTARADAGAGWTELVSLLHAAIDRHKRYPSSALSMGREGATRVDFRLRPDGRIDDLNIGVSSGVRALDLAAYRAVQAIAPFAEADRYLDREQYFQVDVVFRLN
jgi:TonB family protein